MVCRECGMENKDDAKFCKNCGALLQTNVSEQKAQSTERKILQRESVSKWRIGKNNKKWMVLAGVAALCLVVFVGMIGRKNKGGASLVKGEPKEDTWGAVNGMSGSVEYEYDEDDRVTQMTLYNGVTGEVYRKFTYSYNEDNYGTQCTIEMYGPNGILRYGLTELRNEEGYLTNTYGYDYYLEEQSSSSTYTGTEFEQEVSGKRSGLHGEADDYWIEKYNSEGKISERTYYFRDGSQIAKEIYDYSAQDVEYKVEYTQGGLTSGIFTPQFDESGKLVEYKKYDQLYKTYEYDEKDRLKKVVRYSGEEIGQSWELTYDEDGNVAKCYFYNCKSSGANDYTFIYEDGRLVCRDGLNSTVGSGDINHMDYEYYDSGVIKKLICYEWDDKLDELEYVFSFDEDGWLKSKTTYDFTSYYNGEYRPDVHQKTRETAIYNEKGKIIKKIECQEETDRYKGGLRISYYDENGKWIEESEWKEFHKTIPCDTELEDLEELEQENSKENN